MENNNRNNNENNENNKNKIVLFILGVATVLVALIGATFAYFTSVISKPNGDQSVLVTTTTVEGVTYTASDPLVLVDAVPGDYAETTFTISNPNASATVKYGLKFVPDLDDFTNEEGENQLVITVTGGQIMESKKIDYTDGENAVEQVIIDEVSLAASETDEYTVRVDFFETQSVQNTNQGKNFAGHIEVTQSIITTNGD